MEIQQRVYLDDRWNKQLPTELDSKNTIIFLFTLDKGQPIDQIRSAFPNSQIFGCSSGGEILGGQFIEGTTVVSIVKFEKTNFFYASEDITYETSYQCGERIISRILEKGNVSNIMLLTPGLLKINGARFAEGVSDASKKECHVFGGIAADYLIQNSWTVDNKGIHERKVLAIGFSSDTLNFEVATKSGAHPLGIERTITKSNGNVVREVDGKPVIEFYRQYLGDDVNITHKLLQFPLAISNHYEFEKGPLRTPQSIDLDEGTVTFTESIDEGSIVRMMMVSRESITRGVEEICHDLSEVIKSKGGRPVFSLVISCVGRKFVLGQAVDDEVEVFYEQITSYGNVAVQGFYSFGEFATDKDSGVCQLHNQTLNVLVISE